MSTGGRRVYARYAREFTSGQGTAVQQHSQNSRTARLAEQRGHRSDIGLNAHFDLSTPLSPLSFIRSDKNAIAPLTEYSETSQLPPDSPAPRNRPSISRGSFRSRLGC